MLKLTRILVENGASEEEAKIITKEAKDLFDKGDLVSCAEMLLEYGIEIEGQ